MSKPCAYPSVRAVERAVDILLALNKCGRTNAATIAKESGVDRATVYRILATFERLNLVGRSTSDGTFVLLERVRELSEGFSEQDRASRTVARELARLLPTVLWPSDFAVFDQGWMVIRETTHRFSPYSVHRAMVGRRRPLFLSAVGRAVLATADETNCRAIIEIARSAKVPGAEQFEKPAGIESLREDFATKGYAWSVGGTEPNISAIALPLRRGTAIGAINVVFFRSALSIEEAAKRYLDPLKACVEAIGEQLSKPE
jgi:IclR family mhp operon transcriptional activator